MIGDQMKRLLGTIAALALALTALVGVQPASAATSCATARQAALSSALSIGDISLAAKAQGMCNNPCDSIWSFYQSANLSSYVDALVYDAYKTCLAANSGGGGNGGGNGGGTGGGGVTPPKPCTPKPFTKVGKPVIEGSPKTGYDLAVKNAGVWSPKPSAISYSFYRDGKQIDGFQVLTDKDLGKKFSVKVTASLKCYKTTASWITTAAVTRGNLPKFKANLIQLSYIPDSEEPNQLELVAKGLRLNVISGPVWSWVGHSASEWAASRVGELYPSLPETHFFSVSTGEERDMCLNGKKYKIGVTLTVGAVNKYSPAKITIPAKSFLCYSLSDEW